MEKISLKGVVDIHVHSFPDIRERAYTDFQLLEAGVKVGAKAIVLKSHHGTTMDRAFLANEYNKKVYQGSNDFTMYGSITLNYAVGGLNPVAVETALKLGAKIVWLPTIHAENHLEKHGKTGGVQCTENGKVVPKLKEIFKIIKEYDAVLGTSHLSPEEIFIVVDCAKNMGLNRITVTHPEFWIVGMNHEDQIKIVKDYDVLLERCYAQPLGGGTYKSNLADNLEIIHKIGENNIIVDTDGGQVENPNWEIAFEEYMQYLFDHGITKEQLETMTIKNASSLLNI